MCHLDISNNNLSFDEAAEISKIISVNKTLYGLHFIGNYGFLFNLKFLFIRVVDNNGFIVLDEK